MVQNILDRKLLKPRVVELPDTPDLGSGVERRESGSLSMGTIFGGLAQLVEHLVYIQNVGGSYPSTVTSLCWI